MYKVNTNALKEEKPLHYVSNFYWACVFISLGGLVFFGITFPQPPYSDFSLHWNESLNYSLYVKGGAIVFFYRLVSFFTESPSVAALIINSLSWLAFAVSCQPPKLDAQDHPLRYVALITSLSLGMLFFGFWWVAVASTVEVMTIHIALFAVGFRLIVNSLSIPNKKFVTGIFFLSLALSIRIQSVLVIFVGGFITVVLYLLWIAIFKDGVKNILNSIGRNNRIIVIAIFISAFSGACIDFSLRHQSSQTEQIISSQRAQLYIGLLTPERSPDMCGGWSIESSRLVTVEIDESIPAVLKKHLAGRSFNDFLSLVLCKYNRAFFSDGYVWWIPRLDSADPEKGSFIQVAPNITTVEKAINHLIRYIIILLLLLTFVLRFSEWGLGQALLISVIIGYLILYAFLEFNPRYQYPLISYIFLFSSFALNRFRRLDHDDLGDKSTT